CSAGDSILSRRARILSNEHRAKLARRLISEFATSSQDFQCRWSELSTANLTKDEYAALLWHDRPPIVDLDESFFSEPQRQLLAGFFERLAADELDFTLSYGDEESYVL